MIFVEYFMKNYRETFRKFDWNFDEISEILKTYEFCLNLKNILERC